MKLWKHMRALWPRYTLLPIAPFFGWTLFWLLRGQVRWDHLAVCIVAAFLAYGGVRTKKLFFVVLPLGMVALLYDAMRFVKNVGLSESTVHICDLRELEMKFFGVNSHGVRETLHDWAQAHAAQPWDVFFAIPYGVFIYAVMGFAVYLLARDYRASLRFTWGFFFLNMLGFLTYHVYPAAPPWYFHKFGCVVDLQAHASPGPNLLRVDNMIGLAYFTGFYGRSSDIFGAVPSLHVAYPLLMIIEGWKGRPLWGRAALIIWYLWMCGAAVYLDHHWVIDIVLGSIYTCVIAVAMRTVPYFKDSREPSVAVV